jgi:inner membrane protein
MTLAAEAPDLDVFGRFRGPVFGFAHHRGFTHSFLGLVLVSAVVVGFMYVVWRLRGRKTNSGLPPRWGRLFGLAYLAGLSHILLDFTNNYGVRPFWPFWERWYEWDIVFIVEPVLLVALTLGLIMPGLFGLIDQEIGRPQKRPRGRAAAIAALVVMVMLWGVRDFEHRRAVKALEARTYEQAEPIRVGAFPTYLNPFLWHGVVETQNFFVLADVDSAIPEVDPGNNLQRIDKPQETPATLAAKATYLGRVYLDWAKFPITETEPTLDGESIVQFHDLRFAGLLRAAGRHPLSAGVVLDRNLKVKAEFMGVVAQPAPD